MPYNTTAIPPRKEVTGQAQLPLSRVKKIVAQDQDISICSNNAAFVITLATEMFIQNLATSSLNMAKLERKPRRNIQYKDLANAVSLHDNLEFLEDIIPKTVPYKQIKAHAAATRLNLTKSTSTTNPPDDIHPTPTRQTNGKKQKSFSSSSTKKSKTPSTALARIVVSDDEQNGAGGGGGGGAEAADVSLDPNDQLQDEMRKAHRDDDDDGDQNMTDGDVDMAD